MSVLDSCCIMLLYHGISCTAKVRSSAVKKRLICLLTCLLAISLFASVSQADTIVLDNGRKLRGKIVRENEKEVVVDVAGMGTITLKRTRIRDIQKDAHDGSVPGRPKAQPGENDALSPTEKALATLKDGTHWYGVYTQGKKIGYCRSMIKTEGSGAGKKYVFAEEMKLKMLRFGKKIEMSFAGKQVYSGKAPYKMLSLEETRDASGLKQRFSGMIAGGKIQITSVTEGREEKKTIDDPGETVLDAFGGSILAIKGAAVGDKKDFWSLDLEEGEFKQVKAIVKSVEEKLLKGVKVKVYTVEETREDTKAVAKYNSDGHLLEAALPFFTLRMEEEKLAKDFDYSFDVLLDLLIKTSKLGKKPEDVKELKVEISGINDAIATNTGTQKFEKKSNDTYVLTLTPESAPKPVADIGPNRKKLEKFLQATSIIQSDNEKIVQLAREICGNETDLYKKAVKICRWVYKNMKPSLTTNLPTALDILKARTGDCTEYTKLFIALARAAGVPAREISGLKYVSDLMPAFAYHAWPEVYAGRWVGLDPSWNQMLNDATHIKLGDEDNESKAHNVIGKVRIKILSVK